MAAAEDVVRPVVDYAPRSQFLPFHLRDKRWAIIIAHRRAGKTVACVMELLTRALATGKLNARYAYIAPYREQAKTAAWSYLKLYAQGIVQDPEKDLRESDLTVRLPNGSQVRVFGADNPNALRGIYLDGVVMDEYADMKPSLWGEVIRPTLSDRKGWAVFIGTPRGNNAFKDKWDEALRDQEEWYRLMLKASESGILPPEELASNRKQMTEAEYEQEMECSFSAALKGAIYPKELNRAREQKRIRSVPYEPKSLVSTFWDLGRGDSTAIWFYQIIAGEKRFIDYYENTGEVITHYLATLRSRGYQYDTLFLPHDAEHKLLASEQTIAQICQSNGFRVQIVPNLPVTEGINAARLLLSSCYLDAERCAAGIEALENYCWDFNERLNETKPTPLHNWASHGADAFRYAALGVDQVSGESDDWKRPIKYSNKGIV
jgi:phage terminase large subunit